MKTERSIFTKKSVAALLALVLTLVATTAALAARSEAKFVAGGVVAAVGTGDAFSVDSQFDRHPRGHLRRVVIITTDELVAGAIDSFGPCRDKGNGECAILGGLMGGSAVVSLHTSTAELRKIIETVHPLLGNEVLVGEVSGDISGEFSLIGPGGTASGSADLRIHRGGEAVYGCAVGLLPTTPPTPSWGPMAACEFGPGLLIPMSLEVTDSGRFIMDQFTVGYLPIESISGKLEVAVSGPTGLGASGSISVTNGKAVFAD